VAAAALVVLRQRLRPEAAGALALLSGQGIEVKVLSGDNAAAVGAVAARRHEVARTLHERVFAWMTLADERNLVESFVAGESRYRRMNLH